MKQIVILVLLCCVTAFGAVTYSSTSLRDIMEYWLTDDKVVDFNMDGIVNLKDFALIGSYGSDEYGLDTYGN